MAKMSLLDYSWRREIFSSARASQAESSTLSKMTGRTQSYTPIIRPMSLGNNEEELGPLGISESKAVEWLESVMDAEAIRAQRIVDSTSPTSPTPSGLDSLGIVRPMEAGGPLGEMEEMAVNVYQEIKQAESIRSQIGRQQILRQKKPSQGNEGEEEEEEVNYGIFVPPSMVPSSKMGPLGRMESYLKTTISEIRTAEVIRAKLNVGGSAGRRIVRPLDVGGPLGEAERFVSDIQIYEKKRAAETQGLDKGDATSSGKDGGGKLKGRGVVRPMDASVKGPLGEVEEKAVGIVNGIVEEERRRMQNLIENRPMNRDEKGILGVSEKVGVGIFRAPWLVGKTLERVKELLGREGGKEEEEEEDWEGGKEEEEIEV
ncbi:hypothetical protein TrCOL_g9221 [Triparma columacea]|uniref:Uncharacterized protein n=1 Tax=Triparma columacea TaxID=722753 RepID=A0A9W7FZU4_9STRA|nr:hypothetical protein TrCOL_g9221 [Triparma columacea]